MNVHSNPLVDDYLRRLDAAASTLPTHRREELLSEIRDHVEEALRRTPISDDASVRNLLERLGPPEEIVEAADDPPAAQRQASPLGQTNAAAVVSVVLAVFWLAGIGSVLALVYGYRARREIATSAGGEQGSTLATVGIVLGWIGLAMLVLAILGGISLVANSAGTGGPVPVPSPSL